MSDLVTVETFTNPLEANIVRGLLESEGIPASLADEYRIWAQWTMSQALGGVRLQVPSVDREIALDILEARRRGDYQSALDAEFEIPAVHCPNCRSTNIQLSRSAASACLSAASLFVLGIFFPAVVDGKRCIDCGRKFAAAVE